MRQIRINILVITIILICIGLVMIYSASTIYAQEKFNDGMFFLKRHLLFLFIGGIFCFFILCFDYKILNKDVHVSIDKKDNNYKIYLNDELIPIQPIHNSLNFISLVNNGVYRKVYFAKDKGIQYIFIDGQQYRIEDLNQVGQKSIKEDHLLLEDASEICAPMPGKILKILVVVLKSVLI